MALKLMITTNIMLLLKNILVILLFSFSWINVEGMLGDQQNAPHRGHNNRAADPIVPHRGTVAGTGENVGYQRQDGNSEMSIDPPRHAVYRRGELIPGNREQNGNVENQREDENIEPPRRAVYRRGGLIPANRGQNGNAGNGGEIMNARPRNIQRALRRAAEYRSTTEDDDYAEAVDFLNN